MYDLHTTLPAQALDDRHGVTKDDFYFSFDVPILAYARLAKVCVDSRHFTLLYTTLSWLTLFGIGKGEVDLNGSTP